MCVFVFYTNFVGTFFTPRRNERDMIKSLYRSSGKIPVIWSDSKKDNILDRFSKNTQIPRKPVELFHEERTVGLRDLKKRIVAIGNFAEASKKVFKERSRKYFKIWRRYSRNTAHVECKNKIDTRKNRIKWNHLKIIQKISEKHNWKHIKELQTSRHTGHCAHTAGSINVKVRNVWHGK